MEELVHTSQVSDNFLQRHYEFGGDFRRRNNIFVLPETNQVVYSTGNAVVFQEFPPAGSEAAVKDDVYKQTVYYGRLGRGVCCIALHPEGKLLAVAEAGSPPKVFIY
eukprot:g13710.t1